MCPADVNMSDSDVPFVMCNQFLCSNIGYTWYFIIRIWQSIITRKMFGPVINILEHYYRYVMNTPHMQIFDYGQNGVYCEIHCVSLLIGVLSFKPGHRSAPPPLLISSYWYYDPKLPLTQIMLYKQPIWRQWKGVSLFMETSIKINRLSRPTTCKRDDKSLYIYFCNDAVV